MFGIEIFLVEAHTNTQSVAMSSAYLVYEHAMPYSETLGSVKYVSSDKHSTLLGHTTIVRVSYSQCYKTLER